MSGIVSLVFAPGFFSSAPVRSAVVAGGVVAVVSAVVGVFTVMRGQSFAGHALSDMGTTGGSGAFLVGVSPLWGFVTVSVAAVAAMELIGIRRPRGRDVSTGIVFGAALGLAALFLYWDTTVRNASGAAMTILFGSLFTVSASTVPVVVVLASLSLALVLALFRPLLLSSVSPELAAARRVPVRLVGIAYLLAMAVAVSLSAYTIGAILSTALLVGPAAAAMRLTKSPWATLLLATLLGVAATLVGIVLAYDSYDWPPAGHGWPVSVFVVTLVFTFYLLAGVPQLRRARGDRLPAGRGAVEESTIRGAGKRVES